MMGSILSFEFCFDVICLAVAFLTFLKLMSNDVSLSNHRILPAIAGLITIHNFYFFIMHFFESEDIANFIHFLCDICSLIIIFMMFFYFLFIKRPTHLKAIVAIALVMMTTIATFDFTAFKAGIPKPVYFDLLGILLILLICMLVEFLSPSRNFFDRIDRIVGRYMLLAFFIAIVGHVAHDFFLRLDRISSVAFLLDCIILYWLAHSNRIEDTGTILKTTIFDRMEYPIALVNADFYIVDANEKCRQLFPNGDSGILFAFAEGASNSKFILAESLVKENRNDAEYYVNSRWYRVHFSPVEEKQEVKGYIISAFDITEEHMATTNAKTETALKSQFLAHMSHELRSPLHAILGISDVLSNKRDISEKNRNLIRHIKRASENLLELVNAILDYSKLEAGRFEFSERTYDINDLLEDLTYAAALNIQSKPIDFNLAITTSYPRYLYGDAIRVREIFQNIISNAIKFTDKGNIHAELAFEEDDGRQKISFSISDTGRGMTKEQIEQIFNEYVSSADGQEIEGTGLGLAIVKQLISKLDGQIFAESDGISGSCFKGYFYQRSDEGEYLTERVLNKRTIMNQGQGLRGLPDKVDFVYPRASILVADDMHINLEIMQQLLAPWLCEVLTVSDGESAVKAVKEKHFDLVLLDQMMMPVSGPEACRQIKEFSDVPIVLVTANSEDNARQIEKEYGFSDFLGKPILGMKLKEIIEKYLPEDMAEPNNGDTVIAASKLNKQNAAIYYRTLEAFVKEMQPLLLKLPAYRADDKEMFTVKVHGIAGVSKQIGRDTFAEQARIMEMAAKSDTWNYVDEHMDEFLNNLCTVVEDATRELRQLAPSQELDEIDELNEVEKTYETGDLIAKLYAAFDEYDLTAIEEGLELLRKSTKDSGLEALYQTLNTAYENLEYEEGLEALEEYKGLNS